MREHENNEFDFGKSEFSKADKSKYLKQIKNLSQPFMNSFTPFSKYTMAEQAGQESINTCISTEELKKQRNILMN